MADRCFRKENNNLEFDTRIDELRLGKLVGVREFKNLTPSIT